METLWVSHNNIIITESVLINDHLIPAAISINNQIPTNRSAVIAAALVPIAILMVVIFFIIIGFTLCFHFKGLQAPKGECSKLNTIS
jgi:hypothetical protein